mmetsp:Transcript_19157/g.34221  ORF Transcript_19157/g.34221 Transcript_19157/m.34221 type:complete len:249 (+) Transcript_19157:1217-1963(+)
MPSHRAYDNRDRNRPSGLQEHLAQRRGAFPVSRLGRDHAGHLRASSHPPAGQEKDLGEGGAVRAAARRQRLAGRAAQEGGALLSEGRSALADVGEGEVGVRRRRGGAGDSQASLRGEHRQRRRVGRCRQVRGRNKGVHAGAEAPFEGEAAGGHGAHLDEVGRAGAQAGQHGDVPKAPQRRHAALSLFRQDVDDARPAVRRAGEHGPGEEDVQTGGEKVPQVHRFMALLRQPRDRRQAVLAGALAARNG